MTPISISDRDFPLGAPSEIPLGVDSSLPPNVKPPEPAVDFQTRKKQIDQLIGDWKEEQDRVKIRRTLRRNRKNIAEMRQQGDILEDETCIADHTIDKNIAQEKSAYMQYLETSRTLLTFTPRPLGSVPRELLTPLEENFTQGSRYDRWKLAWYKIIDGTCLHGAIGFEIVFDESKPLHFAVDYIRRENFIYPVKLTDIEKTDMFLRVFEYPLSQYEAWIAEAGEGWNIPALKDIVERNREWRNKQIEIYKVYFKENGVVMSGWYTNNANATDWLKKPAPHHIGLMKEEIVEQQPTFDPLTGMPVLQPPQTQWVPDPCVFFPFVLFRYTETEDEMVIDIPGRAAMDVYTQEAITSIVSSTVNGAKRAADLHVSRKTQPGDAPNAGTTKIKHGIVMEGEITLHQFPWPNNIAMSLVQMLSTRNTAEMGRTDFAAMARQDTAKTATEISAAQTQAAALGSIKVSLFADAITRAYQIGWAVARSQQLAGAITLLEAFPPEVLKHDYTLTPSGDVEVIKRQEKLLQMKEFFSVLANTPAAVPFLKFLIRQAFPEESGELIAALDAGNKDVVITELASALEKLLPSLNPQEQNDIRQLVASARSVVVRPGDTAGAPQTQGGPQQGPPSGDVTEQQ